MKFLASINILPQKELLDPQGKTVGNNLHNIGIVNITNVRIGKHITLEIEATDEAEAHETAEQACKKLLANLIMENYSFSIKEI